VFIHVLARKLTKKADHDRLLTVLIVKDELDKESQRSNQASHSFRFLFIESRHKAFDFLPARLFFMYYSPIVPRFSLIRVQTSDIGIISIIVVQGSQRPPCRAGVSPLSEIKEVSKWWQLLYD
jgi:hypothetical protein